MKITDVKVVPVNKFLFVKVMTDEDRRPAVPSD